jgi:hypothetical protein
MRRVTRRENRGPQAWSNRTAIVTRAVPPPMRATRLLGCAAAHDNSGGVHQISVCQLDVPLPGELLELVVFKLRSDEIDRLVQ